jgi:hypothetical protein
MVFRSISRFVTRTLVDPELDRLANFMTEAWADFDREVQAIQTAETTLSEPWARSAYRLLLRAEELISRGEIEQAWSAALSAQRAIFSNPHNLPRIARIATTLRREADKITGWRAKAIRDLMFDDDGKPISVNTPADAMRVIDAVSLRDDFAQNTWFKIVLRRRHLRALALMLWSAVIAVLVLSMLHAFGDFLAEAWLTWLVVIFGILGAAVSVAQSLLLRDVSDRIPMQQLGALVVWTRPGIGAATALIVFALLHANKHIKLLTESATDPSVVAVFSFVAGYSERFIVGALEKFTQGASSEKAG